jgi:hypothetical protein
MVASVLAFADVDQLWEGIASVLMVKAPWPLPTDTSPRSPIEASKPR